MSRPRRTSRPPRSLAAKLGASVLGCEALVVFLGGLTVYGLGALPEGIADWWGIIGGLVVAALMIVTAGAVHTRAGVIVGWVLQAVVALSAILVPAMLLVALIFGGLWGFSMIQGPRIEARARSATSEGE